MKEEWLFGIYKPCNLDCELQHEGFCVEEKMCKICNAKSDNDLMDEEEYNEQCVKCGVDEQ